MKLKWQWFLGGRIMFWVSIMLFVILVLGFTVTYLVDPTTRLNMREQNIDDTSIKTISENYMKKLGVRIDRPIVYRFVKYTCDNKKNLDITDNILLGTFHEWNNTYYIDISVDLYKMHSLEEVVIHETRHMIVEYLKDRRIIDLSKYTEEIAEGTDKDYDNLFNDGINLLKKFD